MKFPLCLSMKGKYIYLLCDANIIVLSLGLTPFWPLAELQTLLLSLVYGRAVPLFCHLIITHT